MFYIMNASCLFNEKSAVLLDAIDAWGDNQTIFVCRRETRSGNYTKLFVSGSGTGYDIPAGATVPCTTDTGMGSRGNYTLFIDNVVEIVDGKISSKLNDEGLTGKRRMWTLK